MSLESLPAHLPRIETLVDVEDKTCPCCKGALQRIGEDVSERLNVVPAQFRVLVVRRPKYACRACDSGVVQSPAPARLIEGGVLARSWAHERLSIRLVFQTETLPAAPSLSQLATNRSELRLVSSN